MSSVNKVILIGALGADPEIRALGNGSRVCNLRLATSEKWRSKETGERKERTEWHRVVVFSEGLVKVIENYVKKGTKLYVEGQLQTRRWQDQQGQDRYSTEIVLQGYNATLTILDGGKRSDSSDNYGSSDSGGYGDFGEPKENTYAAARGGKPFDKKIDDEIPFSLLLIASLVAGDFLNLGGLFA